MEKLKGILKKIFCLPPLPTVLIAVPAFIFVFVILGLGGHPLLAYISYGLSAYALIITVTGISGIYKGIQKGIRENPLMKKLRGIPIVRRYLDDGAFRAEISLYTGVTINFAYVFIKLFSGIYYRSLWFVALAFYYVFLAITRFMLLHHVRSKPVGQEYVSELKRYRLVGYILLVLNLALGIVVTFVVQQNRGFEYGGYLIYVMAIYAFYTMISSVINVVKYRRYNSPVLSAAKAVNLTAALVSMLSLETAMISQFGAAEDPMFRLIMTAVTGFAICAFVLGMAVFMIIKATKKIRNSAI